MVLKSDETSMTIRDEPGEKIVAMEFPLTSEVAENEGMRNSCTELTDTEIDEQDFEANSESKERLR